MTTASPADELLLERIRESGMGTYSDIQLKGDAGICLIQRFMFTYAIRTDVDVWNLGDRWCYKTYAAAKAAFDAWDGTGEPLGWHRHPDTGRRYHNPEGFQPGLPPSEINY